MIEGVDGTRRRKELQENQPTKESYLDRIKCSENKELYSCYLG